MLDQFSNAAQFVLKKVSKLFEDTPNKGDLGDLVDRTQLPAEFDFEKLPGDMIKLDSAKMRRTSAWQNNCGLNTFVHLIADKLESGELQELYFQDPEYLAILDTFQRYYSLPSRPTWDDIYKLFQQYPVATDREGILAPVLRQRLGEILAQENPNDLWNTDGSAAFSEYLLRGEAADMAGPILNANLEKMQELRERFQRELAKLKKRGKYTAAERNHAKQQFLQKKPPVLKPTQKQLNAQIRFQRQNDLLDNFLEESRTYWLTTGYKRYAAYIGQLDNAVMITAIHLVLLGQKLKVGVEIYTPFSIADYAKKKLQPAQNVPVAANASAPVIENTGGMAYRPEPGSNWILRLYNRGIHWTFEDPHADPLQARRNAKKHNEYYPESFDQSFLDDDSLSGKFKTRGSEDQNLPEKIKQAVRSALIQHSYENFMQEPLYCVAQDALNQLVDNLSVWSAQKQITDAEQAQIFENYFTKLQQRLTDNNKKSEIEELKKEITDNQISTLKRASPQ